MDLQEEEVAVHTEIHLYQSCISDLQEEVVVTGITQRMLVVLVLMAVESYTLMRPL